MPQEKNIKDIFLKYIKYLGLLSLVMSTAISQGGV